ncbi:MAG: type II toxin-antitoxin system HicA family toxin [Actinobacteria bacterium]|nr:type II toxin-antitoxin system HicA family toxin [Actinomycetota bacterium]MCL5986832.1 type II toxin-antitoxin system HicA family toxin [Actinomycetota bacterium]
MTKLPNISGKECIRVLNKYGFSVKRQKGSHITLRRDNPFTQVVVPDHKFLDKGTLRSILRAANIEVEEFVKTLKK